MLGQSLYEFIDPEDKEVLMYVLTPDEMRKKKSEGSEHDNTSNSSEDSSTANHEMNERLKHFREQRRQFKIRMVQRINSKRDHKQYETFEVSGLLRLAAACKNAEANGNRGRRGEVLVFSTSIDV